MSNMNKKSISKKSGDMMNSPCTISEAVQIARGVAEDTVADYHRNQGNVQISMSIQIEILKDILISSGTITEEEFRNKYMAKAKELQDMQSKMMEDSMSESEDGLAHMEVSAGDVEIKVEQ